MFAMMMLLLIVSLVALVSAIPEGYILEVSADCGDGTDTANIRVIADISVRVYVDCEGTDLEVNMTGLTTQHDFTVQYGTEPGAAGSTGLCYFKSPTSGSAIAFVVVNVYYGIVLDLLHQMDETYTVTCLNKPSKTINADASAIIPGLNSEGIVGTASGHTWQGIIDFKLVDVLDRELSSTRIPIGKKVQLKATVSGTGGTDSMKASDCVAFGNEDSTVRYTVLVAGCGDGSIINSDDGFVTLGQTVRSPFFAFFTLERNRGLQFTCNFTACSGDCDGSSCYEGRKKRQSTLISTIVTQDRKRTDLDWISISSRKYIYASDEDDLWWIDNYRKYYFHITVVLAALGTLIVGTALLSIYMCLRNIFV